MEEGSRARSVGDAGPMGFFWDLKSGASASHDVSLRAAWGYPDTLVLGPDSAPVANAVRGSHGYFLGALWPEDERRLSSMIDVSTARRGAT